jgi:hypothetical protein
LVLDVGVEPTASSMSRKLSTAELIEHASFEAT